MKKIEFKILVIILFVLVLNIFYTYNICVATNGQPTSLTLSIHGMEYPFEASNDITFTVDTAISFGEKVKLHIHRRASGLVEDYKCWVVEDKSNGVKATFDNTEIDTKWANEADFDVIVEFNKRKKENEDYLLILRIGESENAGTSYPTEIYFTNVSDGNKEVEKLEETNENLEKCYQTPLEDLISDDMQITASNQMLYLRSIIYNDNVNGNHNLWNEFVSNTSPELRKTWYRNMTYYLRDSNPEYQTVNNALNTQIQLDNGSASEESVENKLNTSGEAQQKVHDETESKIIAIVGKLEGEDRYTNTEFKDVLDDIENFIPTDEEPSTEFVSKVNIIFTVITNIGMVVSVLMVAIIGIKYMLGSIEEKAEYKKDMIPYLVGAGLLFGITTIVKILQQFGESINNI